MTRLAIAISLLLATLTESLAADDVPSGHRVALLIGNSSYDGFELNGAKPSLDTVEKGLKARGFVIRREENLDEKRLKDATEDFVAGVPTGGVALLYYIGVGAHLERNGWQNLLRPVGTTIASDGDYRSRAINVAQFVEALEEESGSRTNLIFLDACWQSPLKVSKGKVLDGLHEFATGKSTAVMFGAASGTAVPASAGATPLAKALASNAAKLDESVETAFAAIAKAAGNPWHDGAMKAGIGSPSPLPVAPTLAEGKSPGEGFVNSIGMTFRWCPPGKFTMGSADESSAATRDRKPVQVTLSKGFWIGEHEVTQREFGVIARKNVPNGFTVDKNAPFWGTYETKSVTDLCNKLADIERKAGRLPKGWKYVVPTEAQWEYACRAGSNTAFCFGDSVADLGRYGNFADKALRTANPDYYWAHEQADDGVAEALAPVGSYLPNAWGIRDMHGNVAEVVADSLVDERPGGVDPFVRVEKNGRIQLRGGAWCSLPLYCESSFRNTLSGRKKFNFVGFRLAIVKEN
ncbi:MAG: SUMF1/EgtB/PvdO family nonheme iron enzyme [Pirellulales bacterium]|nr:SUMF1/EgtB/PvdO family nonheme iron enzyme [Pirellulales bacterium]